MGAGRPAGRRRVLHAERLPDHRPAARAVGDRADAAGELLDPARAATAAGPVRDARRGGCLDHDRRPIAARLTARRGDLIGALRQQLVADRPARLLFRPLRPAVAAWESLVAGGGGAVLPPVAVASDPGRPARE